MFKEVILLSLFHGLSILGDFDRGHPQYVEPPVIPGHEFVGEIVKLGPGIYYADL